MDKFTSQVLVGMIVDAIQVVAAKVPEFDNGAIRLLAVPKCDAAVDFFGGYGINCEIDFGFGIRKTATRTRPAGWRNNPGRSELDCYGHAALKISGCSYALNHVLGRRSSDMPDDAETVGRVNDRGCVVYDIMVVDRVGISSESDPTLYFRLYVAVSGAEGEEDERCAMAAGDVLAQWADTELDDDGFGHYQKYLSIIGPD